MVQARASEVFRHKGLHAGNIYYYFANKQELLAFCQQDSLSQLLEMARRVTSEVDPKVATLAVLGAVNWTVKWFQGGGRRSATST